MAESVLVTGGSGLLGVSWATTVRSRHRLTIGLHDREIALRGVRARRLDLDSVDDLSRAIGEAECTLVVHTAGMTNVEACEAAPEAARRVNVDLAVNVATACARAGVALAHISTDHLFGGEHGPIVETDPVAPTNTYGRTKAEAEQRVLDVHPRALVVRTNFYGWGPPYRPSFSDQIIESLRAGRVVTLFNDVTYCPILMEPLIFAVHDLVDREAAGIYHVVGDDTMTKLDFGRRLADRLALDARWIVACSINDKPELAPRPRRMNLSNARASALLGRRLGGVDAHLDQLTAQAGSEAVQEVQAL